MRFVFLDFEINDASFEIRQNGKVRAIEPRVLEFLIYLIDCRDRVVRIPELLEGVWGGARVEKSSVARCVCLARHLLGQSAAIRTVYGRGYQWTVATSVVEDRSTSGMFRRDVDRDRSCGT